MDRKTGVTTILLFLASLFFRPNLAGPAPPAEPPAPDASNSQASPIATEVSSGVDPGSAVCKYFNPSAAAASVKDAGDIKKRFCLDQSIKDAKIRTLTAILPDPELTHLSMVFDRYVESITWAAADGDLDANRYSFNSYWFPWHPGAGNETDPDKRRAAEEERERRISTPGILLFRQREDPDILLLVFLVGETPTSGVNRIAFQQARKYQTGLETDYFPICGGARCDPILGPSFTGSLPSLRRLLKEEKKTDYPTVVISGAVTGITPSGPLSSLKPAHFCTTIETQDNRELALEMYLRSYLGDQFSHSFALLREDETLYGEGPLSMPKGGGARPVKATDGPLVLRYPRGVARIRNLSGQLPGLSTLAPQNSRYPELPLDLRDTGQDSIPSFGQQTPVSQEAVLSELAATLRREHIRYAGIIATDPLDTLFLSRSIGALAPGVRIVVFHADQLFARAASSWGLRGLIAVTSYPLVSRNQYFSQAQQPRRTQFPDESAEGEYNAVRRMLISSQPPPKDVKDGVVDPWCQNPIYTQDQAQAPGDYLLDYTSPFARADSEKTHQPAIWIDVLGHNAWWPVAAVPAGMVPGIEKSQLLAGPDPPSHNHVFTVEGVPLLWLAFFSIMWLGCAAHVLLTLAMNARYTPALWRHFSARVFGWGFKPELTARRRGLSSMGSLAAAITCVSLAVAAHAAGRNHPPGAEEFAGAAIAATAVAVAALLEALWAAWNTTKKWAAAGIAGSVMVAIAAFAALPAHQMGHAFDFAGYRAVHLESGTSPLVPVVFLTSALYLCFWFRMAQLRLAEDRHATLPDPKNGGLWADVRASRHVVPPLRPLDLAAMAAAILCWCLFVQPLRAFSTLESLLFARPLYDYLVIALSTALVALLALSGLRFIASWRALRQLLQKLERSPLRYAFSRFPKDFSWMTVWTGDPRPKLLMPMRALDVLRTIPGSALEVAEIEEDLNFLNDPERRSPSVFRHVERLNQSLDRAAVAVEKQMKPIWDRGLSDTILSREKKKDAPPEWSGNPSPITGEEFLALRFVSFIRYSLWIMRGFLEFLTYGFILLVAALTMYPFEGKHAIGVALIVVFLTIGGFVFAAFAEMDRDPLLSRLSATKPNQLSWNILYRMLSFGALPFLTLLASQVPEVGNFLLSWLQPALQAAK